jgi:hypothetical protein
MSPEDVRRELVRLEGELDAVAEDADAIGDRLAELWAVAYAAREVGTRATDADRARAWHPEQLADELASARSRSDLGENRPG